MSSCHDIRLIGNFIHFWARQFPCSWGLGGISANKSEGDGTTPLGVFSLMDILFRPDRVNPSVLPRARPLRRFDIWSDDPGDPQYNQLIPFGHNHPWSHERLWRSDHLYDVVIPVAYNWPLQKAGGGSAIFIHTWRAPRYSTQGCIALSQNDLMWIAQRITKHTRLIVRDL